MKEYDIALGKNITCHNSVEHEMEKTHSLNRCTVCEDGNLITAKGAGWSVDFAIAIARRLVDNDTITKLFQGIQFPV